MDAGPKRTRETTLQTAQPSLFGLDDVLPEGLRFEPGFVDADEHDELLALAATLPFIAARYQHYTARRRVCLIEPDRLPPPLQRLRDRLARWVGIAPDDFVHALVSEYLPGTPLGWHRDAPMYELVCGVSLGGPARLRLRPHPAHADPRLGSITLDLAPRSAYSMQGPARWEWQHSVSPVPALRYSVTMRTGRAASR